MPTKKQDMAITKENVRTLIKERQKTLGEADMKKMIFTLLALITLIGQTWADNGKIIAQTESSITFVVDEGLEPIEDQYRYLFDGEQMANAILRGENIPKDAYHIIATSFADAQNLTQSSKDAFFQTIVSAYAKHKSVTLSPDMIWLLICQGFARYVNAHSEELRPMLVSHTGKMDLAIETSVDLLSGHADWPLLINGFASQIDRYTKDSIAQNITSDFTTTGPAERVASQITLMESVKTYFEYIVYYISCGIPTITLKGTPADWQHVLDKTHRLEAYGLGKWTKSLEPILMQFVRAAEGNPDQRFWQDIVKKKRVDELNAGGCSSEKPTKLDGWLLNFFPDENGKTLTNVPYTKSMPSERVRVGFKYRVLNPEQDNVISETPMELWAGFIGTEEDTISNTLTPKIGWLVRMAESDNDILNDLKKQDEEWGIELRVKEVPEVLSKLQHIRRLRLVFTDAVVLPEWFDRLSIDSFTIRGKMSEAEKAEIKRRFPKVEIKE